jgi:hypothetical protein
MYRIMAEVNTRLEILNNQTKAFKILKRVEAKTGIETGSSVVILMSCIFSQVLFGCYSQFICEVYALAYPIYASLFSSEKYWMTYWLLNCITTLLFSFLPSANFFIALRFLLLTYLISPTIMKSSDLHDFLIKNVYTLLKP